MKTTKIILAAALALLAAACGKDNNGGRYRLMAEQMSNAGGNAKVFMDPTHIDAAQWVAGETLNINGYLFSIAGNSTAGYSVNTGDAFASAPSIKAIYPAGNAGGNDVTLTSDRDSVIIRNLVLNFHDGGHDVVFPMATGDITSSSESITFQHLTGGMRLTLQNASLSQGVTVGSVRIVTYGDGANGGNVAARNGVTCCWAVQGPSVPGGMPGSTTGDVDVRYSSEMHFSLKEGSTPGKAIAASGSLSFCVPVTVSTVKTLEVTGYDTDGKQLFQKTKTLATAATIQANKMYQIPVINF